MPPQETNELPESAGKPEAGWTEDAFKDAPEGWKFRFVRGTKPELLRLMASRAFRDALWDSLSQVPSSEEAKPRSHKS